MAEYSPKFNLTTTDWDSIKRGALVALAGALVVFLVETVSTLDVGAYTPFLVAIASVLVNVIRKWISEQREY